MRRCPRDVVVSGRSPVDRRQCRPAHIDSAPKDDKDPLSTNVHDT